MKLRLIQTNCSSINSVYIYEDFLEDLNYLNLLTSKIREYTEKSQLDYQTNVLGKMTGWKKLLEDSDFNKLHQLIGQTLYNTINLRNPVPNQKIKISFDDSWGMRHSEGDYTKDHIHNFCHFSGSFYLDVPTDTRMWFEDYQDEIKLENNMLLLFPSLCKHRVSTHIGLKDRVSMAFNTYMEVLQNENGS